MSREKGIPTSTPAANVLVLIRFDRVGHGTHTWTQLFLSPVSHEALHRAVRARHALGSRGIDFHVDGAITVGMMRPVGRWEVIDAADETQTERLNRENCQFYQQAVRA